MNRQEAIEKLSTIGHISVSYAEDLYDSFFPKPAIPQFVADWYEGNKQNLDLNLSGFVFDLATNSEIYHKEELKAWVNDNKKTFLTTLVNMHQFGYEVEKEKRYRVKMKGITISTRYLKYNTRSANWFLSGHEEAFPYRTCHTRKELEANGFGWVFDCPGIEVKEVENE